MHIFIYGPPGVGKSTVIRCLQDMGQPAVDMEALEPDARTFAAAEAAKETFVAMADLPVRKRGGDRTVLLSMDQREYDHRRACRDMLNPGKLSQKRHIIEVWEGLTAWDRIIRVPGDQDPYATAARLQIYALQAMREQQKGNHNGENRGH